MWQTCWAATVFALLMQLAYAFSCGQNTARTSSHTALTARPNPPSTIAVTDPRGRARRARPAARRPPARSGAEPDRRRGEHQGHGGHEYAAPQVAQPQRQAE